MAKSKTRTAHAFRGIPKMIMIWAATRENRTSWFPTTSNTNHAVQTERIARSLKFRIKEVEGFTICVAKIKALIVTAQLICVFVFEYE